MPAPIRCRNVKKHFMEFIKCLIFCFADRVAELIRIAEGYFCEAGIGISSGLLTRMDSLLFAPFIPTVIPVCPEALLIPPSDVLLQPPSSLRGADLVRRRSLPCCSVYSSAR